MYSPEGIKNYYNVYGEKEWLRLEKSLHGIVEYENTLHILSRHLPPSGHILDAAGGPGRYSIELARMGYRVTLVDLSDEQLKLAEKKIAEAGVNLDSIQCMDICDLRVFPDNSFDSVLCLGGALSYVREKAGTAISELMRVAKTGAPVIVSVMSLLGTFHLISAFDSSNFLTNIKNHIEWDPSTSFPEVLYSKGSEEWHAPMTLYSSKGLRELIEGAGGRVVEFASTNTITSSYHGLENISANSEAVKMLLRLEKEFCTKPGLIDMGEHIIAAAIKS